MGELTKGGALNQYTLSIARAVAIAVAIVLHASGAAAQDGTNVLIVVNTASTMSDEIANQYARARAVPAANIVRVTTALTEEIDRAGFEREIQGPIGAWLSRHAAQDRILYIVLTKGIPLRIQGSTGMGGSVASVDSELTLLYRRLVGNAAPAPGRIANPFYLGDRTITEAEPFSHALHDIYLVTRLDGFTVDDVVQLIARGAKPSRDGEIVLDQRAALLGDRSGDSWLAAAAKNLEATGFANRVLLNSSSEIVTGRKQVLGYYSWGSNDSSIKIRRLNLGFVPGALAAMFVSTDARTFKEPPASWNVGSWSSPNTFHERSPQSLSGDLIREGATGVAGHVAEPFLDAAIKPQILFPAYTRGFNLAESFYLAMPYLSWQTVVVGDPLCAPFRSDTLSTEHARPELDPDTELPRFFSARRLTALTANKIEGAAAGLLLRGEARLARGDRAGAQQALEAALAADARLTRVHFVLASLHEQSGDHERAAASYRAILNVAPDNVLALNNLAYALAVHKGAPADALPLATKAYELSRGEPHIADTLGWIHYLLGNRGEAERLVTAARNAAPEVAEIRLHLATIYAASDRKDLATAELHKALELDPDLGKRQSVDDMRRTLGLKGSP